MSLGVRSLIISSSAVLKLCFSYTVVLHLCAVGVMADWVVICLQAAPLVSLSVSADGGVPV